MAQLLEAVGSDPAFLDELADAYLAEAPGLLAAARGAIDARSTEDLVRPAHALKSSSATFGALVLAGYARELEQSARAGSLRSVYAFEATVSIDGVTAISTTGRTVAGASRLSVQSTGHTVEFIEVPPRAWARQSGGAWVEMQASASGDPLSVLAKPTSVELVAGAGGDELHATYPGRALGLAAASVTIDIKLGTPQSITFQYDATIGGRPEHSVTVVHAATDSTPIKAPVTP
jgi:HPt (histidine-containing phosphotransfer) domain-containing protein